MDSQGIRVHREWVGSSCISETTFQHRCVQPDGPPASATHQQDDGGHVPPVSFAVRGAPRVVPLTVIDRVGKRDSDPLLVSDRFSRMGAAKNREWRSSDAGEKGQGGETRRVRGQVHSSSGDVPPCATITQKKVRESHSGEHNRGDQNRAVGD
jgi:hypothetical protein